MIFARYFHNNRFYILLGLALLLLGVLFLWTMPAHISSESAPGPADAVLVYENSQITVRIADTPSARERGLSGTPSLSEGTGMLFVFEEPAVYGFWMKDMKYAIDIIWLDAQMVVTGITPEVYPESYPEVFYSPADTRYVVEVPVGFSTRHGVRVGQSFTFKK